jgi:hypothetical protein
MLENIQLWVILLFSVFLGLKQYVIENPKDEPDGEPEKREGETKKP